jgi:hypothetical protein
MPAGIVSVLFKTASAIGSFVVQLTLSAVGTPLFSSPTAHYTGLSGAGFSHAML